MNTKKLNQLSPDKSSGIEPVADIAFEGWKKELIAITMKEIRCEEHEIRINDNLAKEWFNSGVPPYYCFRENYRS